MQYSPIALFAFNRPDHLRRTVEALRLNEGAEEHDLVVFSDGPRHGGDLPGVTRVREYLRTVDGFHSVRIVERERNAGLAASIIEGVTSLVGERGRVIVLEDDMVTSPWFLRYMDEALDLYAGEWRVISIHGYCYPVRTPLPETFFLRGADCWGWGTWKRGWDLFDPDGERLRNELRRRNLLGRFDFDGSYPYSSMLEEQIRGKNDSWAIRWYASALVHDRLTLYPGRSLLDNIGTDASGSHCDHTDVYRVAPLDRPVTVGGIPLEEHRQAYESFVRYFRTIHRPSPLMRLRRWMKRGGR